MRRPLLQLALALTLGALLGGGLGTRAASTLLWLAALLLVLALRASLQVAFWALLAAALALGAAGAAVERAAHDRSPLRAWVQDHDGEALPVRLTGSLARDPRDEPDRWSLLLEVERWTAAGQTRVGRGRVRLEVGGGSARPRLSRGDRLTIWAQLREPRGYLNPGSRDVVADAIRDGIHAVGYCKSPLLVEVSGSDLPWWRAWAVRARGWARATLKRSVLAGQEQALVRAMVLGDRDGIEPETAEAFRGAGTYHVLALSGAQVALLAAGLLFGLRRLGLSPVATAVLVSIPLAFYAEFVGGDVPVVRATVMAVVLLLGRAVDLDSDLGNLLGLAAGALLVHRPSAVGDVSFQLSFGATLGLILLTPRMCARLPRLPLRADVALASSVAAQAALLPLLLAHFHRLAPAAVLLNLLAVPLSSLVLVLGFLVLLVGGWATVLGGFAGDLAWLAAHALLRSADPVRAWPFLDVRLPSPPLWASLLFVAGLGLWAARKPRAWAAVVVGALGILFRPAAAGDGRLQLTALDVGQGDSLVLRSPLGRVWVIDTGGSYDGRFDPGETVVAPYLWSLGHRRIEGLLLTHSHPDHVGGAGFLLRTFRVGEVWEGVTSRQDRVQRPLEQALRRAPVRRLAVTRGHRASWDGVEVEVLRPAPRQGPPLGARNDDSVVLALGWGEVSLLLAGDMETRAEPDLAQWAPVDLLKVPHHGSRSSSSPGWVTAVRPRIAIISVGYRNRVGHPHPEVVARYQAAGSWVLRTDRDGAVTMSTDGRRVWVHTARAGVERIR